MKKALKFLSWMFVAVLSVLSFSSCSDDDEGHPYAGTVWEYEDIYESGTITTRIRFADETKAYYEVEQRNAGGTIVDNTSSPYSYTYSGTMIVSSFPQLFYPLMTRQFFCDFHEKSEDFCVS